MHSSGGHLEQEQLFPEHTFTSEAKFIVPDWGDKVDLWL
jgi:hypothetical protein